MLTEHTKIAGASAGSLVAACYHSGVSEDLALEVTKNFYADLRAHGTSGRLRAGLEKSFHQLLPDDVHERVRNKVFVAVTEVQPYRPKLVTNFSSKKDFVDALLTSCYIPLWFDQGQLANSFRGTYHIDGGLTQFIPTVPVVRQHAASATSLDAVQRQENADTNDKSTTRAVRVSCFNTASWEPLLGCSVDIYPRDGDNLKLVRFAFQPGTSAYIDELVAEGFADGSAWADARTSAADGRAEDSASIESADERGAAS